MMLIKHAAVHVLHSSLKSVSVYMYVQHMYRSCTHVFTGSFRFVSCTYLFVVKDVFCC